MKYILSNKGNRRAFNVCIRKNRRKSSRLAASFSVTAFSSTEWMQSTFGYVTPSYSYGPAFYIGRTESHLPKPGHVVGGVARIRIRVYPKGHYIKENETPDEGYSRRKDL